MNKIHNTLCMLLLVFVAGGLHAADIPPAERHAEPIDLIAQIKGAWELGREQGKQVMVVMGNDSCDRCALLNRYMQDDSMRSRIEQRFVVLNIEAGSDTDEESVEQETRSILPAIVLMDITEDFETVIGSDQLVTFLPEPYEPIFQWIENILLYTEHLQAAHNPAEHSLSQR